MPAEREKWREDQKAWERAHPGHCGLCGLPKRWCIHKDPVYNDEVMKLVRDRKIYSAHLLKRKAYTEALKKIPHTKLCKIPRPPKDWQVHVLYDYQTKQSLHEVEIPPPHFWKVILEGEL